MNANSGVVLAASLAKVNALIGKHCPNYLVGGVIAPRNASQARRGSEGGRPKTRGTQEHLKATANPRTELKVGHYKANVQGEFELEFDPAPFFCVGDAAHAVAGFGAGDDAIAPIEPT
jgi:hypothetical protein